MPTCPNCSYNLVLLQHRNKYKCALCSRLFPQKEIDEREFRDRNKRQRILDIEDYKREIKKERAQLRTMKKHMSAWTRK